MEVPVGSIPEGGRTADGTDDINRDMLEELYGWQSPETGGEKCVGKRVSRNSIWDEFCLSSSSTVYIKQS